MTQISDAKKGILTEEMKHVAKIEGVSEDFILRSVANGTIVIPSNVNRDIEASGIGAGLRTKVNATVGTSTDIVNFDEEVLKAQIAIDHGGALDNGIKCSTICIKRLKMRSAMQIKCNTFMNYTSKTVVFPKIECGWISERDLSPLHFDNRIFTSLRLQSWYARKRERLCLMHAMTSETERAIHAGPNAEIASCTAMTAKRTMVLPSSHRHRNGGGSVRTTEE